MKQEQPAHQSEPRQGKPHARLIIADDHELVVEALRSALSKHYIVVGSANDGDTLLRLLHRTEADCVLLDLSLPGRNGLELLPEIRAARKDLKVLVVTMHLDRALADAALQTGASGFVPKDSRLDELMLAIDTVLAGKSYLSPRVPAITHRAGLGADHQALANLTPRQQEIVRLIGDGKTTAEIAEQLGLGERTVGFHRTNIRRALGIDSEQGLMRWAVLLRVSEAGKRT